MKPLLALLVTLSAASAGAQHVQGLVGTVGYSRTWLELDDRPATTKRDAALALGVGYRLPAWAGSCLSITPHVMLTATHLRGVEDFGDVAFFTGGGGFQLAASAKFATPYFTARWGTATIERYRESDSSLTNYEGGVRLLGAGFEFPRRSSRRGFDIAVMWASGRFDMVELSGQETPGSLGHKSIILMIGWSGPFRGMDFLFE